MDWHADYGACAWGARARARQKPLELCCDRGHVRFGLSQARRSTVSVASRPYLARRTRAYPAARRTYLRAAMNFKASSWPLSPTEVMVTSRAMLDPVVAPFLTITSTVIVSVFPAAIDGVWYVPATTCVVMSFEPR